MSDIFSEIDEDLRRDRLKSVWQRYQWLIVGVVALFIAAMGGWRGYSAWRASQADTFGDRYLAAISLAEAGKSDDAAAALAALSRTGAPGYTALAALREAGELAAAGKVTEAVAAFDRVAANTSQRQSLRDVAKIRAAFLLIDTAPADVAPRLLPLLTPTGSFRHMAREAVGLAAYKRADLASARTTFEMLISDPEVPADLRNRANLLLTLLAGEGASAASVETKQ